MYNHLIVSQPSKENSIDDDDDNNKRLSNLVKGAARFRCWLVANTPKRMFWNRKWDLAIGLSKYLMAQAWVRFERKSNIEPNYYVSYWTTTNPKSFILAINFNDNVQSFPKEYFAIHQKYSHLVVRCYCLLQCHSAPTTHRIITVFYLQPKTLLC